ncbi:pectate lyase [Persicitalea jodogahamensis]|uniref:Pectate lyase n=1 Tax=Persicitalea jodogahamensis TaxID=402147 RepID=A0A8J3D553_9BACT|nr:pectate lyase [Persicitalea jodogahamensis]GHB84670.1 pectate lyase [Persicitalea jodogahamensis]
MRIICSGFLLLALAFSFVSAQDTKQEKSADYLSKSWNQVATGMPAAWYGSDEAKRVAENVLVSQKSIGGWEKNKPYHHPMSETEKAGYMKGKSEIGATFDNGATITELKFLANMYSRTKDTRYREAFEKGLNYIFLSQYENGGWPQFYPVRSGSVAYSGHITYNDNAMVNTMEFLRDVFPDRKEFSSLQLPDDVKSKAQQAFDKGIACILNTQIMVDGQPTVWCAQHDEQTLAPAKARAYELESFSGAESVGITRLLMSLENPSKEIIASINGAVKWFEANKVEGIKLERELDQDGKNNVVVVADKNAPPLWGRFYDLETSKPYFCDRDGIKRNALADIGSERRNGYSWYTNAPAALLKNYPEWKNRVNVK